MFGPSFFGPSYFGPNYFPPGEGLVVATGGAGSRAKKKESPQIFITNLEERRRLEELAALSFEDIPETIEPVSQIIGLDDFQKVELMGFLERMEEQDREEMLGLEADELLAIMLLLH